MFGFMRELLRANINAILEYINERFVPGGYYLNFDPSLIRESALSLCSEDTDHRVDTTDATQIAQIGDYIRMMRKVTIFIPHDDAGVFHIGGLRNAGFRLAYRVNRDCEHYFYAHVNIFCITYGLARCMQYIKVKPYSILYSFQGVIDDMGPSSHVVHRFTFFPGFGMYKLSDNTTFLILSYQSDVPIIAGNQELSTAPGYMVIDITRLVPLNLLLPFIGAINDHPECFLETYMNGYRFRE